MGDSGRNPPPKNGGKTGKNGHGRSRDPLGRFVAGNRGGGRPRNPYGRKCVTLRAAFVEAISVGDVRRVAKKLAALAELGDPIGLRLFLAMLGPLRPVDPDYTDADELEVRKATPRHLDWMLLELEEDRFKEPAGDLPGALTEDREAEAEAETEEPQPEQDALPAWERFAAERVQWDQGFGAPIDWLLGSYLRWCTGYGVPMLPEDEVLAWLTTRGATVIAGGAYPVVKGVRVID